MSTIAELFEKYVESRENASSKTLRNYRRVLLKYAGHLMDRKLSEITAADLEAIRDGTLTQQKDRYKASINGYGNLMLTLNVLNMLWQYHIKPKRPFPGFDILKVLREDKKARGKEHRSRKRQQEEEDD